MACNCSKRTVARQVVRKASPRATQLKHSPNKRILRKVIR